MSRFGGEPLGRLGLLRPTLNAKTRQSCARNCCSLCRNRTAHEGGDKREVPVNRTDAIGFMGGAQNTNEECYLFQKAARLLGMPYVEHQARL